ncbi:MAG: type IV pilus twitching motility protein PilT [Deltaproteobacteria bacterium]|nr:type IV pilus twitching motility protein PilT [Deltaproteobacteria bacterium]MBW2006833.1 type IV pilus twitching motility protein PilT [Deltaproteobacteria bacterium]MBW2102613.1 type IV pilus twitching motility protein PilT [Deltaproteobacteria bacterium]MBW2347065.1 type IV pilus twitching motility protein PilT [Deltaproteobacteria bacterium]RLB39864.1 MAG: type IV pili twitching motility protein PilT [Deltaproteobacteria bacterium]
MAQIDAFFKLMNDQGASDLHLISGQQPVLRIDGDMERVKYKELDNDTLKAMLYEIAPEDKIKVFEETGDVDFAYEIPGLARYRANFFLQKNGVAAVFREIPSEIMTCEQLGLPKVIQKLATLPRGLVLVTGPTGSGKSTTLAAIVHEANLTRKDHILTIEDPIEFVHKSERAIVNHREVGIHTRSFSAALRGALREDPDIILVGEMRDLETISLAIEASATGHLVFGTLHTMSASKTVDRVIEVFPVNQQEQVRNTLADGIRAVISQTLFKRIDRRGRVAALEIMIATPGVRNLIREGKTFQIPSMIQTGKKYGMQSLDDSIMELLKKKIISAEDAYTKAVEKSKFLPFLKNPPADFTEV